MKTNWNTIARFMISVFYIVNGFLLTSSYKQIDLGAIPWLSMVLFAVGCIELIGGFILFLGYKKSISAILLFICTLLTTVVLYQGLYELFNNLALAAGLLLIINNHSGVTLFEYAQADINDLPDYKVKM